MSSDGLLFHRQVKWFVPAAVLLFLIFALELFLSARLESQTFDEPAHLYAGYSYWLRSDFGINPEHPPLVKLVASLPLFVDKPKYPEPLPMYFRAASAVGGVQLLAPPGATLLLDHARLAVSLFAFLLALLVVLASLEMFGQWTALFALALLVFDPLILGHGPLLGTDVAAACCIFATVYSFYRYVKRPSLARLVVCALITGLALAAKHSAILMLPVFLLLCAVEIALWRRPTEVTKGGRARYALRLAGSLVAICAISVAVLWAFYGFRYTARPGGQQIVPPTAIFLAGLHSPNEAHVIAFAERHHLLPEAYLYGLTDVTILSNEGRPMFLFGKLYPQGRWFYFPAAFLIKSTIGFLVLLALVPFARGIWRSEERREVLFLIIPVLVFFGMAMASKLDIGIRHIMPAMPFLIVLVAAGAVSLAQQSRVWAWAVSALLALHIIGSVHAFPNYLPYSNELFGGVNKTHRVLSDSNVGWGGGLKALRAHIERQHITQCWLAYSAFPDPAAFGIPCRQLPTFFSMLVDSAPPGGRQQAVPEQIEGPVFVSSEEASGSYWGHPAVDPYGNFPAMRPSRVIAGEILEFDGSIPIRKIASTSHWVRALTLRRQGKADQAVPEGEAAVAIDPDSLYAHETLSEVYAAVHRPDDAMREYRTSMQLFAKVDPAFADDVGGPPENPLAPQH